MKILRNILFFSAVSGIAALYLISGPGISGFFYDTYEKFLPPKKHSEKILIVSAPGGLSDYKTFLKKTASLERSVALFTPHIFDRNIGDFLEGSSGEDIERLRADYREFSILFAESQNVIPVVSLKKGPKSKADTDPSAYSYFKASKTPFKMEEHGGAAVKNTRLWMTAPNMGFFPNYESVPYRVPFFFNSSGEALVAAQVEAVRRYYGLTKSKIDTVNRLLSVGSGIRIALLHDGQAIIRRPAARAPEIQLKEFADAAAAKYEDKIIIFREAKQGRGQADALAAAVSTVLSGETTGGGEALNFVVSVILALLLLQLYRNIKIVLGSAVFLVSSAAAAAAGYAILMNGYFFDATAFIFMNAASCFGVYYLKLSAEALEKRRRVKLFAGVMHPKSLKNFIASKKDIRLRNVWLNTAAVYFDFESGSLDSPAAVKKAFDKISAIIYNNVKDFIIKLHGSNAVAAVVLQDNFRPKDLFKALFEIREELKDFNFNITVSAGRVYIFEFTGTVNFMDPDCELSARFGVQQKKRHIIVAEKDIQKFINIIKFQKISGAGAAALFNVAGFREEG